MRKTISLIAIWWLFRCLPISAQPSRKQSQLEAVRDVVFKLSVYNKKSKGDGLLSELTAFKLNGHSGLYTALHGLTRPNVHPDDLEFTAVRYARDSSGRQIGKAFESFKLAGFNVAQDIAYLKSDDEKFNKLAGLIPASKFVVEDAMPVYIVGFPGIDALKSRKRQLDGPALERLEYMLPLKGGNSPLSERKSPGLDQQMLQLEPTAAFSGDSGCPIFNLEGELIGMADGGVFNSMNDKISAWAVPIRSLQGDKMTRDDKQFERIAKLSPPTFLMAESHFKPGKSDTPLLTFGGTFSRPFWLTNEGSQTDRLNQYTNGRFDGYVEWTPRSSKFAVGFYLSSRYLQYRVFSRFEHNLPLQAERTLRQSRWADSYGLQASWIISRGAMHNTFIGGGLRPSFRTNDEYLNYRGFIGYRLYTGPRRRFGLELRAMYVYQDFLEYRQTLGIARRQIQTLNQFYLCAGLTHSFYRRD